MSISRAKSVAAAVAGAIILAGCPVDTVPGARDEPSPSPVAGGTLRFGVVGEPATLDPTSVRASVLTFLLARPRVASPLRFRVTDRGFTRARFTRGAALDSGPFRLVRHQRGLKLVLERNPGWDGSPPLLDRVVVYFIESLDIAIALLERGRLDAASLPVSVNLDERLDEIGLAYDDRLGFEAVHLRFNDELLSSDSAIAVGHRIDRDALIEGFVRDDGRLTNALYPAPCCWDGYYAHVAAPGGEPPATLRLAAPAGDQLLDLMQRALQVQLRKRGIAVELVTVPASTLYGEWLRSPPVEAFLARTLGRPGLSDPAPDDIAFTAVPLAQVETLVAWRDGVHGVAVDATLGGPLRYAGEWWKDPGL